MGRWIAFAAGVAVAGAGAMSAGAELAAHVAWLGEAGWTVLTGYSVALTAIFGGQVAMYCWTARKLKKVPVWWPDIERVRR
jgi:hypothetical protein